MMKNDGETNYNGQSEYIYYINMYWTDTSFFSIPKIYFGSRTHKQLVQVVRELKRTKYCSKVKMTILGSRQQTCVNEMIDDRQDKSQRCKELLKDRHVKTAFANCLIQNNLHKKIS